LNSPEGSPHEAGSLIEGASACKEETEVNMTQGQTQVAASGKLHLFSQLVVCFLVCCKSDLQ